MKKVVTIFSGGLDSTVLCYFLKELGNEMTMISFDYSQRHKKELEYAEQTAKRLGSDWKKVDLSDINPLLAVSSLTNKNLNIPIGPYNKENLKSTVVPNRNAIMLAIAWACAISNEADAVATAVHGGDFEVYPDCRPDFFQALGVAFNQGNTGMSDPLAFYTPFINFSKSQIVKLGAILGAPLEKTWSCYKGQQLHCGECSTCIDRKQAFIQANIKDRTEYAK